MISYSDSVGGLCGRFQRERITDAFGRGSGEPGRKARLMQNRWPVVIGTLPRFGAGVTLALALIAVGQAADKGEPATEIARRFTENVRPVLKDHCFACHGGEKQEAKLDLSSIDSATAVAENPRLWRLVRQRLETEEMPPEDAKVKLPASKRQAIIAWISDAQQFEAEQNAGDPGRVLARRLNAAEFDYTIRDLTGVNIRPAREFPVDPANEAGFDNSGESLAMSPALMRKYLAAARLVADHVVLRPRGFHFAPFPTVAETDRDKYCVQRIIAFYERHQVDYADYFLTAWRYRHRQRLGRGEIDLRGFALADGLSPKYLQTIWSVLNDPLPEVGPLAEVRSLWRELPVPDESPDGAASAERLAREGCRRLRDLVIKRRSELSAEAGKLHVEGISDGSQPFVLWRNRQSAALHMKYAGDLTGDEKVACERFCHDFPRAFVVSDRGPYFDPKQAGKGRLLTAGFHLMQGYFRDDQPLYDLVLDQPQQQELDALWQELNFITQVPIRQYKDFIFFERAEPPRFMREAEFDFARSEDKDATSPEKMKRLAELHVAKARRIGASDEAVQAIETYYTKIET
jgi:hypothetical protein